VSPVLDQRSRIVQTDLFSLVDQPLQLGPLSFGNCTLIILIKQIGYSRLRYRIQLQKTPLGFFQRNQFAQVDAQNEADRLYNPSIKLLERLRAHQAVQAFQIHGHTLHPSLAAVCGARARSYCAPLRRS